MTAVGITGHQSLSGPTQERVKRALMAQLRGIVSLVGVTSLAAGADQIFAGCVTVLGGDLIVVVPSEGYERTFATRRSVERYRRFLQSAIERVQLDFEEPTEQAFWSAGREVVRRCDVLCAVWDGRPAAGLGGTADVVAYARELGKPVHIIWPSGSSRS